MNTVPRQTDTPACIGCGEPLRPPEAARLGMPSTSEPFHRAVLGETFGEKWRGYQVEVFGEYVEARPRLLDWPYWIETDEAKDGSVTSERIVRLWLQRIRYRGSPVYLETRWDPRHGADVSIRGLQCVTSREPVEPAIRALKLMDRLRGPGAPPGARGPRGEEAQRWLVRVAQLGDEQAAYQEYKATQPKGSRASDWWIRNVRRHIPNIRAIAGEYQRKNGIIEP